VNLLEQIFLCRKLGYRAFGGVAQRLANLVDGGIEVVVDIEEGVWPEALVQLFTSENVARRSSRMARTRKG
jgi:predicted membrane GTPase involved in stress response